MTTNYDFLGIGNPCRSCIARVEDSFLPTIGLVKEESNFATMQEVVNTWNFAEKQNGREFVGGSAALVAKVVSRLGMKTALYGQVAEDRTGNWVKKKLERDQIGLFPMKAMFTPRLNTFVTSDQVKTMQMGTQYDPSPILLDAKRFQQKGHVYLEGALVTIGDNLLPKSLELAKANHATISLDLANTFASIKMQPEIMKSAAQKADILFGSRMEMTALTGTDNPEAMMKAFALNQVVVIIDAGKGYWVKGKGEEAPVHYATTQVANVVDREGDRDFFIGGFLSGYLKEKSLEECVQIGAQAEALVIQELGSYLPKRKWKKLASFIQREEK